MLCVGYGADLAVKGSNNHALGRFNAYAPSQHAGGKGLVGDFLGGDGLAGNGREDSPGSALDVGQRFGGFCLLCGSCGFRRGVLEAEHPGKGKSNGNGNRGHKHVIDGVMEAEQQPEEARHAGTAGAQSHKRGVHRARRSTDGAADKGLEMPEVHAEDGRLGNAHEAGEGRGERHGFQLAVPGLQRNRQRRRALGHVRRRRKGQPVGHAVL